MIKAFHDSEYAISYVIYEFRMNLIYIYVCIYIYNVSGCFRL